MRRKEKKKRKKEIGKNGQPQYLDSIKPYDRLLGKVNKVCMTSKPIYREVFGHERTFLLYHNDGTFRPFSKYLLIYSEGRSISMDEGVFR